MNHLSEEIHRLSTIHYENIALFEMRYDFFRDYVASVHPCTLEELSKKDTIHNFSQRYTPHYASINTCINDIFGTCSLKDSDHMALHHALRMCIANPVPEQQRLLMQTVLQTIMTLVNSAKEFRVHLLFVEIRHKKELSESITRRVHQLKKMQKPTLLPSRKQAEGGLVPIQEILLEMYTRISAQVID